jgi:xanthine phosphoribosyltransferase
VVGIGTLIEKTFEGGRAALSGLGVPVHALAMISGMDENGIRFEE